MSGEGLLQIETLDLHFLEQPHLIASYVVRGVGSQDVVLVESGPGSTIPALVAGLATHGLTREDITHVLLTHVHLDHAGAAGWVAASGAQVFIHHRGVQHLVDPSRLWSSATRIYGEAMMEALWGEMLPIPEAQITSLQDGDVIKAAGRQFVALDTPGHASHHMAFLVDGECFTGDVAGCALPDADHLRMPTPPPDLDLVLWEQSLAKLEHQEIERLYLTHFGQRDDPTVHLSRCRKELASLATFVRQRWEQKASKAEILEAYFPWMEAKAKAQGLDEAGLRRYENVVGAAGTISGMLRYFDKQQAAQAT